MGQALATDEDEVCRRNRMADGAARSVIVRRETARPVRSLAFDQKRHWEVATRRRGSGTAVGALRSASTIRMSRSAAPQRSKGPLVTRTLVGGNSPLDALGLDHHGALHDPPLEHPRRLDGARKRPPCSCMTGPGSSTYSASLCGSRTERNVFTQYAFRVP